MQVQDDVIEYYKFLVKLRNSGVTNMLFPAVPAALEEAYELDAKYANNIVDSWIESFDLPEDEQPDDGRYDEYEGEYDDYVN